MQLTVDRVGFAHRGAPPVLQDISLVVERGESIAIVGPSGSGKTTLLALIGGLLRPQTGAIHLSDAPGAPPRPVMDETSWVLQTVNVLTDRSVLDNVVMAPTRTEHPANRGSREHRRRSRPSDSPTTRTGPSGRCPVARTSAW